MDADEPASRSDVSFKGSLFGRVEDVSGRVEKYDYLVSGEACIAEARVIFGAVHGETVSGAEFLDGTDPVRYRIVTVPGCLRKDEHGEARFASLRGIAAGECGRKDCSQQKRK